ncbi:MAG TPA: glycolate oxidase subunit GlcE [Burkholderiales bacterium]|nr:glycolate oxidase subunit GlcE [Burkholderiales bacterium]
MDAVLQGMAERVRAAAQSGQPLRLRGGGTKDFYGNMPAGEPFDTRTYAGIVSHEASELVVTARCGTPLAELEDALAEANQMLPFEPPHFGTGATLGGCVAAGLSGPRRASAGALRDFVLGARLLDGRGRLLSFGGQVMKNVAGYDVSRLLAGSLGTLGVILEVSLKVLPRPAEEDSLRLEAAEGEALERMNRWAGRALPISATSFADGVLCVRLSGAPAAVCAARESLGGAELPRAAEYWTALREHSHPAFAGERPLWRLSVPSTTPPLGLPGTQIIEWGGALRWLASDAEPGAIRDAARRAGGHATLFRARDKSCGAFAPLSTVSARLHRELKAAFDPAGVFNRGRLYPDL